MTVEHSEQAKAAWESLEDIPTPADAWMSGFDRGLAERRVIERETLAALIYDGVTHEANTYEIADAILALPSTPPAPDEWKEFYRDASIRIAGEVVELEDKITAVLEKYEKFWEYSPEDGWRFYRDMSALVGREMPND